MFRLCPMGEGFPGGVQEEIACGFGHEAEFHEFLDPVRVEGDQLGRKTVHGAKRERDSFGPFHGRGECFDGPDGGLSGE